MSAAYFFKDISCVGIDAHPEKRTNLLIQEQKIDFDFPEDKTSLIPNLKTISASHLLAFPGFIDLGTRTGEPGGEIKETLQNVAEAAVASGYTSIIYSPETNPPIDSPQQISYIQSKTKALQLSRFFPLACVTKGGRGEELSEIGLLREAGALGFYEDDRSLMNTYLVKKALEYIGMFDVPYISYCEDHYLSYKTAIHEGTYSNILGLRGSPAAAEEIILARDLALCKLTQTPIHFIKVSTASGVHLIRKAKEQGLPVSASTSIAHLYLSEEDLQNYETNLKTNPPLRTKEDREALKQGLLDHTIDFVISDHNPQGTLQKIVEFDQAEAGMSTIDHTPALLYHWCQKNGLTRTDFSRLISGSIKKIFLKNSPPCLSDITIFNPEKKWVFEGQKMLSKSKNSAFLGTEISGKTQMTFVKGQLVYEEK